MYRLTMRSGVSSRNDNLIGDLRDERTAYLMGDLLLALDRNNHPEYRGFDVERISLLPLPGTVAEPLDPAEARR